MREQASAAFEKLQTFTTAETILSAIEQEVGASWGTTGAEEVATVEAVSEFDPDQPAAEFTSDEVPSPAHEAPAIVDQTPEPQPPVAEAPHPPAFHVEPAAAELPVSEPAPGVLEEFVTDLESSLGESFLPQTSSHQAESARELTSAQASTPEQSQPDTIQPELEPIGSSAPTTFGIPQTEPMGEFVADLEASLGDDFLKAVPVAEPEPEPAPETQPVAQQWPVPTSEPAPSVSAPVASAAAAAASSGGPAISQQASTPVPKQSVSAPAAPKPPVSPIIPSAPAAKSSPFGEDAGVDLAEMFGELKHDLEVGASTTEEDPDTHYNLGIAFREMGLLDEAIGELQKTCQAVDRGHPFPQVMQTYTWLAQCFLDKGVPQAAIRSYLKALHSAGIDQDTRTALYYQLASAHETAGDKPAALKNFMEVYGRNIDYRDVAERIKPLKS